MAYYVEGKANMALVPDILLTDYDLDAIDGEHDGIKDRRIGNQVGMLFDRLGIYPFTSDEEEEETSLNLLSNEEYRHIAPYKSGKDLMKYRTITYPMKVDKVISIFIYL
jgi:hypothetical protein